MAGILLGLMLVLLLDQNDRAQGLAGCLGERARAKAGASEALSGLLFAIYIIVPAGIVAVGGALIAPTLSAEPRLLLLGLTMSLGGGAMLWRPRAPFRAPSVRADAGLAARLLFTRFTDRGAFALFGVAAFSGQGWAAALGGVIGGFLALFPPFLLGARYAALVPLTAISIAGGVLLLLAGTLCALTALDLI